MTLPIPVEDLGLIRETGRNVRDFVLAFGEHICRDASRTWSIAIAFLGSTFYLNLSGGSKL